MMHAITGDRPGPKYSCEILINWLRVGRGKEGEVGEEEGVGSRGRKGGRGNLVVRIYLQHQEIFGV